MFSITEEMHVILYDKLRYSKRGEWQPTPVILLRESYGQKSLVGYSSRSHKNYDRTEQLTHTSPINAALVFKIEHIAKFPGSTIIINCLNHISSLFSHV